MLCKQAYIFQNINGVSYLEKGCSCKNFTLALAFDRAQTEKEIIIAPKCTGLYKTQLVGIIFDKAF